MYEFLQLILHFHWLMEFSQISSCHFKNIFEVARMSPRVTANIVFRVFLEINRVLTDQTQFPLPVMLLYLDP